MTFTFSNWQHATRPCYCASLCISTANEWISVKQAAEIRIRTTRVHNTNSTRTRSYKHRYAKRVLKTFTAQCRHENSSPSQLRLNKPDRLGSWFGFSWCDSEKPHQGNSLHLLFYQTVSGTIYAQHKHALDNSKTVPRRQCEEFNLSKINKQEKRRENN